MKKLLGMLFLLIINVTILQARLPISKRRVKKELLGMFEAERSRDADDDNDMIERYKAYVTAEKQIKYLTAQVNELYGYLKYLDRLKVESFQEHETKKWHLATMQKNIMKRCQKDYWQMDEEGLNCFCHYSRRIASSIFYNEQRRNNQLIR